SDTTCLQKNADSAYSSIQSSTRMANDNDDRSSTTSSVPIDPSTQVPVFLSSSDMEFVVAGDAPDMRKVLTLYNPYDYPFEYRISCTAPEYYDIKTNGTKVLAKHLVEITIRGKSSLMPNMIHRIKVDIMKLGRNEVVGSKIVTIRAVTFPSQPAFVEHGGGFHRIRGEGLRRDIGRGGPGRMGDRANPNEFLKI
ncbi:hypothetical protein PMAYCL1PPCAC_02194, partial [Pristionchus mayeri]